MTLFNTIVNVTLYRTDKAGTETKYLTISTPSNGPKPHMSLSTNQVQGGVCFQTTLTIYNLNISQLELRTISRMVITAGYKEGSQTELNCPVFTAYRTEPMPNGQTIIIGVAIGKVKNSWLSNKVNLFFRAKDISLQDLIVRTLESLTESNMRVDMTELVNHPEIANTYINIPTNTLYAENIVALIDWLNTAIDVVTQGVLKIFVYNDQVVVKVLTSSAVKDTYDTIPVANVTDISFTGALLHVTAPWDPRVIPGRAITVSSEYYAAQQTPNVLSATQYVSPSDIYTVVLMSYEIDTEGQSTMTLSAIRAENVTPADIGGATDVETLNAEYKQVQQSFGQWQKKYTGVPETDIYYPAPPVSSNDLIQLYMMLQSATAVRFERNTLRTQYKGLAAAMEQKYGRRPLLTLTEQQCIDIMKAAKLEHINITLSAGYKLKAAHLMLYACALTYVMWEKTQPATTSTMPGNKYHWQLNPISDIKPWSYSIAASGKAPYYLPPSWQDAVYDHQVFWKRAADFCAKGSTEWITCIICSYIQRG